MPRYTRSPPAYGMRLIVPSWPASLANGAPYGVNSRPQPRNREYRMLPDHLYIDAQTQVFRCDHCGASETLPARPDLVILEQIVNDLVVTHQGCTKVVAPTPVRHAGCWNKPRPSKDSWYMAQDGWTYSDDGRTRTPKLMKIFHKMSTDCRYDQPHKDSACAGCVHMNFPLVLENASAIG